MSNGSSCLNIPKFMMKLMKYKILRLSLDNIELADFIFVLTCLLIFLVQPVVISDPVLKYKTRKILIYELIFSK